MNWHQGGETTSLMNWKNCLVQSWRSLKHNPDVIITSFPQLAMCVSILKLLRLHNAKIVAHNFYLGDVNNKLKGKIAGFLLGSVDRFLIHSPCEKKRYSEWLNIPEERFKFVYLQRGNIDIKRNEDESEPYILAMGSANRDYPTLVEAIDRTGLPTIIVTKESYIKDLPKVKNITYKSNLTQDECTELLAKAKMLVTTIKNKESSSGQVTFISAMQLGVPQIVTECAGSEGYVTHMKNGLLVKPFDPDDLSEKIQILWSNPELSDRLVSQGKDFYQNNCTDFAAAENLSGVLNDVVH